jgi:hypothetical protein
MDGPAPNATVPGGRLGLGVGDVPWRVHREVWEQEGRGGFRCERRAAAPFGLIVLTASLFAAYVSLAQTPS